MKPDAWYKGTVSLARENIELTFNVPHDVFSTLQIDEGTLALLDHLPTSKPSLILDMGCGYGALGLPVAALNMEAEVHMVDRDLLAVEWAGRNAENNVLANTEIYGSLGFRDLRHGKRLFDWILCNVPARIGDRFIEDLFVSGNALLASGGEIRVVVIRDLGPTVEKIGEENKLPIELIHRGPRHIVYALKKSGVAKASADADSQRLYQRDRISVGGVEFDRPYDISGDSIRVEKALPILIDGMPKREQGDVLCVRSSYGILPILSRVRWPGSRVKTFDRDLLATTFTRENAARLDLMNPQLEIEDAVDLHLYAANKKTRFDLITVEVSASVGRAVVEDELALVMELLKPGAQALLLCGDRLAKEVLEPFAKRKKVSLYTLITRNSMSLLRMS